MLPFLQKLHLAIDFHDEDLAVILRALSCPLRELDVTRSFFGDHSAQALLDASGPHGDKKHCSRLEKLFITDHGGVSGAMVQRIMCECS